MQISFLRGTTLLLLALAGCTSPWRDRFPDGSRLYERDGHKYFGKVIAYDPRHDFGNGMAAGPAVLIQSAGGGHPPVWGSCATCAATMDVEKP